MESEQVGCKSLGSNKQMLRRALLGLVAAAHYYLNPLLNP